MVSCFEYHGSKMSWSPSGNSVNTFEYIALKLIEDQILDKLWAG